VTLALTGLVALHLICPPGAGVSRAGQGWHDLIGAWVKAPSTSCLPSLTGEPSLRTEGRTIITTIQPEVIAGIDTHADTHHVAVIDRTGQKLADAGFPATAAGYAAIVAFITTFGAAVLIGIEGTHSYGAGVTSHLAAAGFKVVEVIRPARAIRRMRGKSDPIDACQAAASALATNDHPEPKQLDGVVEAMRYVHAARRSAVKARMAARVQIKSLLVTAPEPIRARYRRLTDTTLFPALARTRPALEQDVLARTVIASLRSLARRHQQLTVEITTLETELEQLVAAVNPGLQQTKGIGTVTAAQLLITAGENVDRLKSEASFAALCGTSPIPASSGKTTRHRLNRGGDRHANSALHQIALTRMTYDDRTRAYIARKQQEGKSTKEILRCLKRAIAREVFTHLTHPAPAVDYQQLRQLRQDQGIIQTEAAHALGTSPAKISLAENGKVHDAIFLTRYAHWLQTGDLTP
jgi:transposase